MDNNYIILVNDKLTYGPMSLTAAFRHYKVLKWSLDGVCSVKLAKVLTFDG